jgi:glucosyl-3-phosphoglycerate synthase
VDSGQAGGVDTNDDPADDAIASLSVVIPARNEAETIAAVVTHALESGAGQVLVVDGDSADATATEAAGAGAEVVRPGDHFRELGPVLGKGDALWRALPLTTGSTVAFLDGDLTVLDDLLPRLLAPLARPGVVLAKADIRRLDEHGHRRFGRVSQFTARPLLSLLFSELDHITEPLSGQVAARRDLLMALPFEPDYGLEVGMLLDIVAEHGVDAVAHPDCGRLLHGEQSDTDLQAMATVVAAAILRRAGLAAGSSRIRPPHLS